MKKRILFLILAISLILNTFTYNISYGLETNKDIITRVYTNKEYIPQGTKGVDYNISYIYVEHESGYTVDSDKFDLKNLDKVVKIIVNGQEENPVDSKGNLKYTVDYNNTLNRIEIKVKENQSNLTYLKPFILRKHSHYNIHIPKGFFTNGKNSSDVINFNFTTKGDGEYGHDIVKNVDPSHGDTEIDHKNGKIILTFIDDIELNKDAENKKDEYFSIISEKMTNPPVDNFNKVVEENIDNYLIYVEGNQLILKKKTGKLDDFAKYKITIAKNGIILKNSSGIRNIKPISNDTFTISFDTNNWVEWTYPINNQGIEDSEKVERNPLIKIKFKYGVELIDKSKITLSSDGHIYAVDVDKDTWINYDGNILKIDVNSLYRSGENPLRANTAYKLTIGKGALRLKDYNIIDKDKKMENEEINLYFITGEHFKDPDRGLRPIQYTSKKTPEDDITKLSTTKLEKDGNIYIHFHTDESFPRQLKWNQWTVEPKVKTDQEALKYFKLYKSPQAYIRDHDSNGVVYDKEFRYNIDGKSIPIDGLDEIPLQSVEILKDEKGNNTNILKITPKYDLIPYNKYFIKLIKRDILTDNYEKIMWENESLVSKKGQEIWTAPLFKKESPSWEIDKISPEQIIEVEKGPYKSTYVIHGATNYNSNKPITLYVDEEVVLNPYILKPLDRITLFEGYREGNTSNIKRKIEWYKLEYFFEEGIKKTKISLYPQGELDSGKYYELDIAKDVFKSRSDRGLEGITLQFVVEGDQRPSKGTGIYKFEITNKEDVIQRTTDRPFLITDFEKEKEDIQFSIIGYNFTEDIKQLRFVRRPDGKTIILSSKDLEFQDITNITGSITGQAKSEFAKVIQDRECGITRTSAGVYDIYIDFQNGKTASLETINQRFIVKDRPKVIDTIPYDGEDHFNPELLYKKFKDPDEEGYYIKIVFENIGGTLELKNQLNHGIQVQIEGEEGNNLVDRSRPLRYEIEKPISKYTNTKFNLYIPLIEKLKDGQNYEAYIPQGDIIYYSDVNTGGNRCYRWKFNTNYFPKAERLYEGSVPERYDWRYPIVIDGYMFHYNTTVYFRDGNGKLYSPDNVKITDNRLYIFLPKRGLPIGLYDIIISNGTAYSTEMVYGVLSVVEQGGHVPNEEYRVKDESSLGTVKETINTSEDTLEVHRRHTDRGYLEINLDELMGTTTWVRKIEYPASWNDKINELVLKSKWTNVTIEDLKLHDYADNRQIELRVGRVEPSMADILKNQLIEYNIKSNLVEVSGVNFDFYRLTIEIPYFESDGNNLKLLRYDEESRDFEEIDFYIDLIDRKLTGYSMKPGIFLIVE